MLDGFTRAVLLPLLSQRVADSGNPRICLTVWHVRVSLLIQSTNFDKKAKQTLPTYIQSKTVGVSCKATREQIPRGRLTVSSMMFISEGSNEKDGLCHAPLVTGSILCYI